MNFAVVQFADDPKIKKVVPVKGMRESKSNEPFNPLAGEDFDEDTLYKVKWQSSFDKDDGFFDASVLCLAGSVNSALAKAADLGHKLPENALLVVPPKGDPKSGGSEDKKSRATRKRKDRSRHSPQKESSTNSQSKKKKDKIQHSTSTPKGETRNENKDSTKPKQKKNSALNNPVVKERLQAALQSAKNKPLSSNSSGKAIAQDLATSSSYSLARADTLPISSVFGGKDTSSDRDDNLSVHSEISNESILRKVDRRTMVISDTSDDDDEVKILKENLKLKVDFSNQFKQLKKITEQYQEAKDEYDLISSKLKASNEKAERLQVELNQNADVIAQLKADLQELRAGNCKTTAKSVENVTDDYEDGLDLEDAAMTEICSETKVKEQEVKCSPPSVSSNSLIKTEASKKKKRKGYKVSDADLPQINLVADTVFNHLNGQKKIPTDSQGMINIGFGLKIDNQNFVDNFKHNATDIPRMTRNLTTLVWSKPERMERSLDGLKSNRYKDCPPKQAATPCKINAVLGCVKAHLKNNSTSEGAAMDLALQTARKVIGLKFNEDTSQEKRKRKD